MSTHSGRSQQSDGESDGYASELSLPGEGPGRTLTKQDYIFLHAHHCRQTYTTTISGTKVPVVCCRTKSKCPHHRGKEDDDTCAVGGYLRIHPPGKRAVYGAMSKTPLTLEEYENLPVSSQVNLDDLAAQMAGQSVNSPPDNPDPSVASAENDPDPVVEVPAAPSPGVPRSPQRPSKDHEGPPTRPPVSFDEYYGLERPRDGRRVVLSCQDQSLLTDCIQRGYHVTKIFQDHHSAAQWCDQEPSPPPSVHLDTSRRNKTSHHRSRRTTTRSPSTSDASDTSDYASSDSEASSSESSDSTVHRRRKKKSRGKNTQKSHQQKSRPLPRISGEDPSKGDKDKIYGMRADGGKILKATTLPGLRDKDIDKIYDSAIDVVSLPGMYQAIDYSGMDEAERLSTVMGVALGRDSRVKGDALWRSISRNSLGTVRSRKDFMALVDKVVDSKEAAFTRQNEGMTVVLRRAGYSSTEIKDYLKTGGLPRLLQDTFTYYMELLMMIQRMTINSNISWDTSQAGAIAQFHSTKLGNLRTGAGQRRSFILSAYIYLRDARAHKFNDVSMMSRFWKALESDGGKLPPRAAEAEVKIAKDASTCSHCRCPAMHVHLRREMIRNKCPLKDHDSSLARKAAPILLKLKLEHPSSNIPDLVEKAVSAAE